MPFNLPNHFAHWLYAGTFEFGCTGAVVRPLSVGCTADSMSVLVWWRTMVLVGVVAGITGCLLGLLGHGDPVVRQKTTEALLRYAGHSVGRTAIIKQKLAKPLSNLFNDGPWCTRSLRPRSAALAWNAPLFCLCRSNPVVIVEPAATAARLKAENAKSK
jgi:hypothetical protein